MRTIYEVIWSIVGVILISWFCVTLVVGIHEKAAVPQSNHQKQTIEEFLNDHPDIKQRVDEIKRQAEYEKKYNRS